MMNNINDYDKILEEDVVEKIHERRAQLLEKFGGDLRALFEDARRRDEASDQKFVNHAKSQNTSAGDRYQVS